MDLIQSNEYITIDEIINSKGASLLSLEEIRRYGVLDKLDYSSDWNPLFHEGSPIYLPSVIASEIENGELNLDYYTNPLLQYYLIAQIKGKSEINAPSTSIAAQRHFFRMKQFCQSLEGELLLDIGCDKPSLSHKFYPEGINYIGIDPSLSNNEFKIIGMAETLPFKDQKFDLTVFNTSLDHILDYQTALEEAHRILKPFGRIIIASYVWIERATLLSDNVHFHHFREQELLSSVSSRFAIDRIQRYEDPKNEKHRYGIYIEATKLV